MDIKQNQYNQCSYQNQQHNPKNSFKDISSFDALTEYAVTSLTAEELLESDALDLNNLSCSL